MSLSQKSKSSLSSSRSSGILRRIHNFTTSTNSFNQPNASQYKWSDLELFLHAEKTDLEDQNETRREDLRMSSAALLRNSLLLGCHYQVQKGQGKRAADNHSSSDVTTGPKGQGKRVAPPKEGSSSWLSDSPSVSQSCCCQFPKDKALYEENLAGSQHFIGPLLSGIIFGWIIRTQAPRPVPRPAPGIPTLPTLLTIN